LIKNEEIKNFVKKCMEFAPDYFWEILLSSTGKSHPQDERGNGGEILHTRRVVKLADDLCRSFNIVDLERDCVIAAAIMHDWTKNGYPNNFNHTVAGHGALWISIVTKFMRPDEVVNSKFIPIIGRLIGCHMGRFDMPFIVTTNKIDLVIQIADYIASREYIKIDI
jgi:hypothetical protein